MTIKVEMTEITVSNADREVRFVGALIAEASSGDGNKPRWAEMSLYRTESNKYIVHGVGKSTLSGEGDREWVLICDTADAVVPALMRVRDGVSYMPHVNTLLLDRASMVDDDVSDAARVKIIT